ncbi:filamin-A-interacting protein 1-like [Denticeps clupeoides]|uniref:Cortactin-binding protein-2 N-terminal domain-containing protein n=1 Tax=Denticeps clupeoides TaxID=299321 RepID=A0AAY4CW83_9TELE|nr:filamin-A-interacting protein 1-like [Denticeps clupeoides]
MRTKSNRVETPSDGDLVMTHQMNDIAHEQEEKQHGLDKSQKVKSKPKVDEEKVNSGMEQKEDSSSAHCHEKLQLKDLSKDDLLKLLGIMEGELQAQEDAILILKAQQGRPETLQWRYGSAGPQNALQALQRDGLLVAQQIKDEDVYKMSMVQLDQLQHKHKESYRRMLEQLLLVERCHRQTIQELETEKCKHADYMNKSDDFTNLLEQERERLKKLLVQERAYQVKKEKEHRKRLEKVRGELVKLKSFALMLVDERQLHLEKIDKQNQKIQELIQKLQEKEQKLSENSSQATESSQKIVTLEADIKSNLVKFAREHEEMTAKLTTQETQNGQLCQKVEGLISKIEELEESNGVLQKSADELQELRNKIRNGEFGNTSLMSELENLRKKVLKMEGKDEEISKTEVQCRELRTKLQDEESHGKELKMDVDKLQKRISELEKLERSFSASRSECALLHSALDEERSLMKELTDELVAVKIRMKELESTELRLEKAELTLKDDLMKLKSVTVIMINERKSMAEKIRSEEKKKDDLNKLFKAEQEKVMEVTEKLIEESKMLLKLKSELETTVTTLTKEKEELKTKLAGEEARNKELCSEVSLMKQSLMYQLEEPEKNGLGRTVHGNKVCEITLESKNFEDSGKQIDRVNLAVNACDILDMNGMKFAKERETHEVLNKENSECQSCKMEAAKTRELEVDVVTLKEKILELMNKEDQLSRLQVDYSVLRQRFAEEQYEKNSMSNDVFNLIKELEITKRYSRCPRPTANGRCMVDVSMASSSVQTDAVSTNAAEEDTPAVFIKKSVQEENRIMSNLRQKCLRKPSVRSTAVVGSPASASDLNSRRSWIPWIKKKDGGAHNESETTRSTKQQQMPDHVDSKASLEIKRPCVEDLNTDTTDTATSSLNPRTTIIPTVNAAPPNNRSSNRPQSPVRAKSPLTFTTISRAKSPEIKHPSTERPMSPVSIVSASTSSDVSSSPEPQEMITGRAVFKVTPEKQMVPAPIKKHNSNATENTTKEKIHLHSGTQFKISSENNPVATVRPVVAASESKELSSNTVVHCQHNSFTRISTTKLTSSMKLTSVCTAPARPTFSVLPVADTQSSRSGVTRIPMSRGMKTGKGVLGSLGISTGMKSASHAEGKSSRSELKKSSNSSASSQNGLKN